MPQLASKSTAAALRLKTHLGGVRAAAIACSWQRLRLRQGARQVSVVHRRHADNCVQQGIWHRSCR